MRRDRRVVILSGTHGTYDGRGGVSNSGLKYESRFFHEDIRRFRSEINRGRVWVYDIARLSDRAVRDIIQGNDEVIAAFCYGRYNNLINWSLR